MTRPANQVLNLLHPFGETASETDIELENFRALTKPVGRPLPINLHRDPAAGPMVGYRVPVLRNGELRYILSAEIAPAVYGEILARQKMPPQAVATVIDGRGVIVATSARQELVGESAGPLVSRVAPGQTDGWFEGRNREGVRSYAAYSRSPANNWAVSLAIPAAELEAPLNRSLWALGAAGVIFLVVGIMLAVIVEARITEPLDELTRQTGALGRGEAVTMSGHSRVTEVEHLRRDIGRTAGLLEERGQERDRAAAALRELNDRLELRILERTEQLQHTNNELRKEIRERKLAEAALRAEHVYLNLLRSTELASQETRTAPAALKAALEQICPALEWPVGYYLIPTVTNQQASTSVWCAETESDRFAQLRDALESASVAGIGPAALALGSAEFGLRQPGGKFRVLGACGERRWVGNSMCFFCCCLAATPPVHWHSFRSRRCI